MSGKRIRIGGEYLNDPNTIEARDTYFVSLEKGVAGNDGRSPETPMTLDGALTVSKELDASTKGLYGTKLYILPTTTSQSSGEISLSKRNMSVEGISVTSRHGYGVNSNPSMFLSSAGTLITISADEVELVGLSLNAKAANVKLIGVGKKVFKPFIAECRFYNYGATSGIDTPLTGVVGIDLSDYQVDLADIRNNTFYRCPTSINADVLHNSLINGNTIMGPGFTGQTVTAGIVVATGSNVEVSDNEVLAGSIGGVQGTTGINVSDESCAVIRNAIGGWTTPTAGTALVGGTITVA